MKYSLIYSRAISYLHCFNVCMLAAYAFYFSDCIFSYQSFIIKATFGDEALIRGKH